MLKPASDVGWRARVLTSSFHSQVRDIAHVNLRSVLGYAGLQLGIERRLPLFGDLRVSGSLGVSGTSKLVTVFFVFLFF